MSDEPFYKSLDQNLKETRVLDVQGSPDPDSILDCQLRIVSLPAKPRYEAISYTWGEGVGTELVLLNGGQHQVPASAASV